MSFPLPSSSLSFKTNKQLFYIQAGETWEWKRKRRERYLIFHFSVFHILWIRRCRDCRFSLSISSSLFTTKLKDCRFSLSRSPQRRSHLSPCWLQKKKLVALTHIIFGPLLTLFLAPSNKKLAQENSQNYQQPKSQKEKIQLNKNHLIKSQPKSQPQQQIKINQPLQQIRKCINILNSKRKK